MIPIKLHRTIGDIEYVIEAEVDKEYAEKGEAIVTQNVKKLEWCNAAGEEYLDYTGAVIYHEGEVITLEEDELQFVNVKLGITESELYER